jgi:uncharacterized protein YbjT (DUF2867 family)
MILITGATGHVGGELLAQLAAAGHPVRAMTRRPDALRAPAGVEVVHGDAADPATLDAAFAGAERAFLMSAQPVGAADRPTHDIALAEAATRAGLTHVVKLSVYGGGGRDDPIGRWHREAEAAVTGSGLRWTLLRPGRFASNALQWAPMIRRGDTVHLAFADRAAATIDPADVAAVAAEALTTDGHDGLAHQLSGPMALTPREEVAVLAAALGRGLHVVELPAQTVREGMLRSGMPGPVIDAIMARTLDGDEGTEVLPTVSEVLGRPPRTFARWADAHAGAFRPTAPAG